MSTGRTPAACRNRLRARVAGCLCCEHGDTLIEVLVAALLGVLIASGTLVGYEQLSQVTGDQRQRAQADSLAQQDQARLRGLSVSALAGSGLGTGNQTTTQQVNGTTFTIASVSTFVAAGGSQSCTSSGNTTADEVQTSSTVSWSPNNDGRGPVVVKGLIAPPQGGSLVVRAANSAGALSGVTITLSGGPTLATPLVTDANGCAVFGALAGGGYTVTASDSGYLTTSTAITVVPTTTAETSFTLAPG